MILFISGFSRCHSYSQNKLKYIYNPIYKDQFRVENSVVMLDPIQKYSRWKEKANKSSPLSQKNAVCISTIDFDGYPTGRFADLKDFDETGFIICTSLNSPKGKQIAANSKVSITVWWDHVGYQIRINGIAKQIPGNLATQYWCARSRDAQLATISSNQSEKQSDHIKVTSRLASLRLNFHKKELTKPKSWGGFKITPQSMEFLEFQDNRLHIRELYKKRSGGWQRFFLQP